MLVASLLVIGCMSPAGNTGTGGEQWETAYQSTIMSGLRLWISPETTDAPVNTNIAHQQITQNSPKELQEELREYMLTLSWVVYWPSRVSVPWAKALFLSWTTWPTLAWNEWGHLHPESDGSLHIALDKQTMQDLVDAWWWEYHPRNPNAIMIYGPRNREELAFIKKIIARWLLTHREIEKREVEEKEVVPYSTQALKNIVFSWHSLSLEAVENRTTTYTRYRIFYMSNGYRISGILNIPIGDGTFPLVILNHGYIDPAVYTVWRWLKREQDYLARQWFAVLHTDYRSYWLSDTDEFLWKNYIFRNYFYAQDAINAILAVKESSLPELSMIDSDNVWMLGHSMWWWVTMHSLIAQPALIDAAILYAPVHSTAWYNFDRWRSDDLSEEERNSRIERLWGLEIDDLMPYSATPYVDEITVPLQIYFGKNDKSVPYQRWVDVQEIMLSAWVESELITYQSEWHEFISQRETFMKSVTEFLNTNLTE
jgi:pimeloyl-ACP methyl ester carboxylesterase